MLRLAAQECGQPVRDLVLVRQSIDARKKTDVHIVCAVRCTCGDERRALAHSKKITRWIALSGVFPRDRCTAKPALSSSVWALRDSSARCSWPVPELTPWS